MRCNYKILRKTPCGANNYSCRKIDLPCITASGNCHGNNYTSVSKFEIVDGFRRWEFERNAFELFDI